ncbi:hypothetical protein AB0I84_46655 [Streptomyces spectabilis]|uniref:hypothetical protein n=1 Tax=Streptomyces spectabilis TaxID=68270 RepID=UPI00340E213E
MAEPSYGHTWADWLYGSSKDGFMVEVYDDCEAIDKMARGAEKAVRIVRLRERISGSRKAWSEGIIDFLDFESYRLANGHAPVVRLGAGDDFKALSVLDAAYRHGAFRGLCRCPGGAEYIGELGEWAAAMVHQGFKWVRKGDVDEWELPALGEAWCKGFALWGLSALDMATDTWGDVPDNDEALYRNYTVMGAHHFAGFGWHVYRGPHPHMEWDPAVRGRAPGEDAIRQFGAWRGWSPHLTDVLVRAAHHVNTWVNPQVQEPYQTRTRGLVIGEHTPRLLARTHQVVAEMAEAVGDLSPAEIREVQWRSASWLATFTATWRGRGDAGDMVSEMSTAGALLGALRDSRPRPHLTVDQANRLTQWGRSRVNHLSAEEQKEVVDEFVRMLRLRGRMDAGVPVAELATNVAGTPRWTEGAWAFSMLGIIHSRHPAVAVPPDMRVRTVELFHALTTHRRIRGKDVSEGHQDPPCAVCVADDLFRGFVDHRPSTGMFQSMVWGAIGYHNQGVGEREDMNLGTR